VVFKQVLPKFIDAVRLCIGPAIVFLIAAEMVVGDVGFGYRIRLQFKLTNMNVVYPYLVFLAGFGYLLDYGLRFLQSKICPWYQNNSK
jgi:ABC-type nitrate/sulfonate/bicarbonate transport system permease component